jgi:hypothetical protein
MWRQEKAHSAPFLWIGIGVFVLLCIRVSGTQSAADPMRDLECQATPLWQTGNGLEFEDASLVPRAGDQARQTDEFAEGVTAMMWAVADHVEVAPGNIVMSVDIIPRNQPAGLARRRARPHRRPSRLPAPLKLLKVVGVGAGSSAFPTVATKQ